jgi:cob(I)alamin adenosyltransferase
MKIYTKTGDSGQTGLWGGTRISKADTLIEAYGNIDELNCFVGLLISEFSEIQAHPVLAGQLNLLLAIQHNLFICGSELAADTERRNLKIPRLPLTATTDLEDAIDTMEADLPPLRAFILPGGTKAGAWAHICRTICRRAERSIVKAGSEHALPPDVLPYINRLSDYFFTLARALVLSQKGKEIEWHPQVS